MPELKNDLRRLEGGIRRLKVEFDRFFNGAVATPPEELRGEIELLLRHLRRQRIQLLADRFLLNALEARFNSLCELVNRKLREMETAPSREVAPDRQTGDAYAGVVFDEQKSQREALVLYRELYGAAGRSQKTDFASFLGFLEQKAAKIRQVTGCSRVQFRVIDQDGQLTLKAKAVDHPTSGS